MKILDLIDIRTAHNNREQTRRDLYTHYTYERAQNFLHAAGQYRRRSLNLHAAIFALISWLLISWLLIMVMFSTDTTSTVTTALATTLLAAILILGIRVGIGLRRGIEPDHDTLHDAHEAHHARHNAPDSIIGQN